MNFDLVVAGSGFASVFFVKKALETGKINSALILERGRFHDWEWQASQRLNSLPDDHYAELMTTSGRPGKEWVFNVGVGGGSNCWWANPMRFHPDDFRVNTLYGVGADWPIGYDDLERHYSEAEAIMEVSGDDDSAVLFPRSRPYPQRRHRFSRFARLLKDRYPQDFFAMPQARARDATEFRNPCCSNSVCTQCPMNAKFTIVNDMPAFFQDTRIELRTDSEVVAVLTEGGRATGFQVKPRDGDPYEVTGETVVLAANGIFNPFLLKKSGINDGPVGRGLNEQAGVYVTVDLDNVQDGDGSAHVTGVGYTEIHGDFRREASGGFFETQNLPQLRAEKGKWGSRVKMAFLLEDFRDDRNYVDISADDPNKPNAHFEGFSDYTHRGIDRIVERIPKILADLPVEDIEIKTRQGIGHAHIQGTAVMGDDPSTSVVDAGLVHHRLRNLLVLGSSAFPTGGWANPTLTLNALSLRAAEMYYGGAN